MLATLALLALTLALPPTAPADAVPDAAARPADARPADARRDSTAAVLPTPDSYGDRVQRAYALQRTDSLRTLLREADARADRWLALYRLYPLTEDASLLDDLPDDLRDGTAREYALLSGLWAYRAGEASLFSAIRCGRRSMRLLEAARAHDALDPYVLLVEGQSLLYRPAIAGRDVEAALQRFRQLQGVLDAHDDTGIAKLEAKLWTWFALRELGRTGEAKALKSDLLAQDPPALYRQFLLDPPKT
jgi:hypothetical protein